MHQLGFDFISLASKSRLLASKSQEGGDTRQRSACGRHTHLLIGSEVP